MKAKGIKGAIAGVIIICSFCIPSFHASGEGLTRFDTLNKKGVFSAEKNDVTRLEDIKNRQMVVKMKEGSKFHAKKLGLTSMPRTKSLQERNLYIVQVPHSISYEKTLNEIASHADVMEVQPDILVEPQNTLMSYNPLEKRQWYLQTIKAAEARGFKTPLTETVVAVIDSGVDYKHPDLAGQVTNGYNVYNDNTNPMDRLGHGTRVAGIIGAGITNGIGISGINSKVKIMPLKAGDGEGLSLSDTVEAIYFAIDHGANVINMSYGSDQADILEYEAIEEAYNQGIVVVAATGNENSEVNYPGAYPQVIAVGAVDQQLRVTDFSNKGNLVDLVAPGTSILSTNIKGTYDWGDGTSFATPMVSGAASYIKGIYPDFSPAQIEYLLEKSASKVRVRGYNTFLNPYGGYGILNLYSGLQVSLPSLAADTGNSREEARGIKVGQAYSDRYDMPMDEDWYKLTVDNRMRLQVDISGVRSMDAISWFGRMEDGEIVQENVVDNTGVDEKEQFRFNVKPGTYYFQILELNNHWSPEPYKISFSEADVTPPSKPVVKTITSSDTVVRGSAERGAKIIVKKGNTTIGSTIATARATFQAAIPKQPQNTRLTVYAIDPAGNSSIGSQVKVK
ncbi:S8 family serine peptidase [Fictibacillus sp. 7GRE50]|uniref:S8 family serine peptidase n=1 Tax=Fictibacillus sp. 7GRE50 TaxID=2745878 RepID=UPI0018CEAB75|nr:S8 family serine peptidase [Fictibacillus sp. 7GRE50]MBH0164084.1 S8 family serine peptidase [Fictibacillus sp. 7GRE50]